MQRLMTPTPGLLLYTIVLGLEVRIEQPRGDLARPTSYFTNRSMPAFELSHPLQIDHSSPSDTKAIPIAVQHEYHLSLRLAWLMLLLYVIGLLKGPDESATAFPLTKRRWADTAGYGGP